MRDRDMSGILTIGFDVPALVPGVPASPSMARVDRDDLPRLTGLLQAGVQARGRVVVLYPSWDTEPTLRHLETALAGIGSPMIAAHPISTSPVAGAVLASIAGALSAEVADAGVLLATLPLVEEYLVTVAWLRRVSGLTEPAPGLANTILSYMPGTSWAVTTWREPAVHRLRPGTRIPLPTPQTAVSLVMADHDGDPAWIAEHMAEPLRTPMAEIDLGTQLPEWWGSPRVTEAVAFPSDVSAIAAMARQRFRSSPCRWCGGPVCTASCPWCGEARPTEASVAAMAATRAEGRVAGTPGAPRTPELLGRGEHR